MVVVADGTVDADDLESFWSAQAFLESLGPEFGQARADLRHAARINAFVPVFFTEPGLMEVETFDLRVVSGPADAIEYLQSWGVLWHITDLPIVFLAAVSPRDVRNLLRNPRLTEEFEDIVDHLVDFEGEPWWEAFDEAEEK